MQAGRVFGNSCKPETILRNTRHEPEVHSPDLWQNSSPRGDSLQAAPLATQGEKGWIGQNVSTREVPAKRSGKANILQDTSAKKLHAAPVPIGGMRGANQ